MTMKDCYKTLEDWQGLLRISNNYLLVLSPLTSAEDRGRGFVTVVVCALNLTQMPNAVIGQLDNYVSWVGHLSTLLPLILTYCPE